MSISSAVREFIRERTEYLSKFNFAHIQIEGDLPEEKFKSPIPFIKTEKIRTYWDIESLLLYIRDSALSGVLITLKSTNIGYAKANSVRTSLKKLRDSGKSVYVHLENPGNIEYFIASVADHISVSPMCILNFTGISSETYYFRDMLDHLEVVPEITGVGEYKSAAEKFNSNSMSDYSREMFNSILDEHFGRIISSVSESRKVEQESLIKYLEEAPFTPSRALELGLVDDITYENKIKDHIEDKEGITLNLIEMDRLEKILSYSAKFKRIKSGFMSERGLIGLVPVEGIITQGKSRSGTGGIKTAGSDTVIATIEKARKDSSVSAVVIRVMSPGGSAVASDLIRNSIEQLAREKPVYISMSDIAASGGYMLSLPATRIFADVFTLTGSVGVVAGKLNLRKLLNRIGITTEILTRGRMSSIYSFSKGFTDDERKNFHSLISNMYDEFVKIVSISRNMTERETDQVSRGRVWTGSQAVSNSLVDKEGGLPEVLLDACSDAGLETENLYNRIKVFSHDNRISVQNIGSMFGNNIFPDIVSLRKEFLYCIMPYWPVIR